MNNNFLPLEKPSRYFLGEKLCIGIVAVLLLALHFQALKIFTIAGHIDITLVDIIVPVTVLIWLMYVSLSRLHIGLYLYTALFLVLLFVFWIGIQAFRSPEPIRGFTMFLLALRNIVILCLVKDVVGSLKNLQQLNKIVFLIGVGVSLLSLVLYVVAMQNYQNIIIDPSRWKPAIIYEIGKSGILRLEGFTGDPNFYSIWMSISLFCGLTLTNVRKFWKWIGIFLILSSILVTFSRGFILAFVMSTLLIIFVSSRARKLEGKYVKPLIIGIIVLIIIMIVPFPFIEKSPIEWWVARFGMWETSSRFTMWNTILASFSEHLLIGTGLRSAEYRLGGMCSHNSYLDLLFESGLIGLGLWLIFVIFIIVKGKSIIDAELLPWFHSWVLVMFMFLFFSLLYNPFHWIIVSVILAQITKQKNVRMSREFKKEKQIT